MAKKTRKKASKIKTKRKTWHAIIAPVIFGKKQIGEMYLSSLDKALGRSLKVNLRDLTGSIRDQNAYIQFKISKEESSSLYTKPIGFQLTSAYVKRMVRKNTSRVDDYLNLETKTGEKVIVKTLVVTRNKVQRSVRTEMRAQLLKLLSEEIGKVSFDDFLANLVSNKVLGSIKKKLAKVYPIREVALRSVSLIDKSKITKGDSVVEKDESVVVENKQEEISVDKDATEEKVEESPVLAEESA